MNWSGVVGLVFCGGGMGDKAEVVTSGVGGFSVNSKGSLVDDGILGFDSFSSKSSKLIVSLREMTLHCFAEATFTRANGSPSSTPA